MFKSPLIACCFGLTLLAGAAQAQGSAPAAGELEQLRAEMARIHERLAMSCRVAIFDLDRLLAESKQGMALEKQLNEFRLARGSELQALDAELLKLAKSFDAEKTLLAEEELARRGQGLLEKRNELAQATLEAGKEWERRREAGVRAIRTLVGEIGVELAQERRLDLVLDRSVPLVASSRLDVTEEILRRLNERES